MIRNSQEHAFPEPPTADRDWFGGRRWTGIAASGVILLVIVVALFLLVRPHDPESAGPARASASNTSMTSSAPEAMTPSSGSTSRLDVSPPTAVPAGISWSLYQSVALPSSSTAGPLTLDGDIATGYAHTPVGALIAAANISTRYFLALDLDYRQAAEAMVAPGVGRDAWIALRAKESHPTADPAGTYAQIAGFNFLSYSPADSVVQLATRAADGSLQAVPEQHAAAPVEVLRAHGEPAAADSLDGTQALHPETRGSVYFTARAATASLRDRQISRWVTRQSGSVEFDARAFVESRQSLYLMSKGIRGGTTAASLVAALTNEVRVAAERASERNGGRLDPPMLLVLDEVANICRIADLPEQYSHLGSRSIVPIAILQSYAQGERVWGRAGMRELWGAATIKLIGSGADDADFAEDVSRIIGEHEINTVSISTGHGGRSQSTATRRERILSAAELRALPKNRAVLLATGIRPALIELLPWYQGKRAKQIDAAMSDGSRELQGRAAAAAVGTRR